MDQYWQKFMQYTRAFVISGQKSLCLFYELRFIKYVTKLTYISPVVNNQNMIQQGQHNQKKLTKNIKYNEMKHTKQLLLRQACSYFAYWKHLDWSFSVLHNTTLYVAILSVT